MKADAEQAHQQQPVARWRVVVATEYDHSAWTTEPPWGRVRSSILAEPVPYSTPQSRGVRGRRSHYEYTWMLRPVNADHEHAEKVEPGRAAGMLKPLIEQGRYDHPAVRTALSPEHRGERKSGEGGVPLLIRALSHHPVGKTIGQAVTPIPTPTAPPMPIRAQSVIVSTSPTTHHRKDASAAPRGATQHRDRSSVRSVRRETTCDGR